MRISAVDVNWQDRFDALPHNDDYGVSAASLAIEAGWRLGCSDLHLSSRRDFHLLRGRRDGVLLEIARIEAPCRQLLVSRLKVISKLPSFVFHEPQDGRIEWRPENDGRPMVLRISFLPTLHGESVVLRYPEERNPFLHLGELGMSPQIEQSLGTVLSRREGTILLTGPGNSGKTTTMYAMLSHLANHGADTLHILTIEDPIERDLDFAEQVPVNEAQGLGYEAALRAALRQDPNVLMIGEIRDLATARIAMQAGTSGHLVLSSLHAGRALGVFTRLTAIGIERWLLASALQGVLAQRLVRVLCASCRMPVEEGNGMESPGCGQCAGTGISGRTGVFEMVEVTDEVRGLFLSESGPREMMDAMQRKQRYTLESESLRLVEDGIISARERELLLATVGGNH